MFDLAFSELLVIAIVALIVLGPERLPKVGRFAGLWIRRARAQWHSVKSEFEIELADSELKRSLRKARNDFANARDGVLQGRAEVQREFAEIASLARAADESPALAAPAPAENSDGGNPDAGDVAGERCAQR